MYSEKAPSGYGLGDVAKYIEDANAAIENGWYRLPATCVNTPGEGGNILAVGNTQLWYSSNYYSAMSYQAIRVASTDTWSEWQWITPANQLGVLYRLNEFWQGKPVYAKTIDIGALPAATVKRVAFSSVQASLISLFVVTSAGAVIVGDGKDRNISSSQIQVSSSKYNVVVETSLDLSATTAVAICKFVID